MLSKSGPTANLARRGVLFLAAAMLWPAPASAQRTSDPSPATFPVQTEAGPSLQTSPPTANLFTAAALGGHLTSSPVEVELEPYFRELRTVEIVSGRDTLRFLLDTGGGHTLVTPEVARILGCRPFGRSIGHRMSGERVEFQWCKDLPLEVGGVSLSPSNTAVFDLAVVLPPELPTLHGLLSLKSFSRNAVSVDLAGGRLVLESDSSAKAHRARMAPLLARTATGEDGTSVTVFLAAHAEPGPIWLLLDSGNLVGTILSPHARRLLSPSPAEEDAEASEAIVPLHLVGLEPESEPVVIRDIIYDGALGASFFMEHVVMFDFRGTGVWVGAERRTQ